MTVERRYGALRVIASILKVFAWLVLVVAVGMGIMMIATGGRGGGLEGMPGPAGGLAGGVMALVIGAFYFIMLYACAEGIIVVLDIEHNTRLTTLLLLERPVSGERLPAPVEPAPAASHVAPRAASPPAAPPG